MYRYVLRRVLLFAPTLLLASVLIFGIMRVLPGDVALAILGSGEDSGGTTLESAEALREQLGLNDPLVVQYGRWLWSMASGDFGGESLVTNEAIGEILARRFPVTIQLAALTLAITLVVSLPLGVIAALQQDRWPDYLVRGITVLGLAMPNFWVALLVLLGLVVVFVWSPPVIYVNFWESPGGNLQVLIWPALVVAWGFSSYLVRVTRAQVLEVLRQDYIRTAQSKGLALRTILTRHVMRNALIPIVTLIGTHLDASLSGSVILENIFGVPGVGQGIVLAANFRDWLVIQTLAMALVLITLTVNLVIDLTYALIDPRISYG